MVKSQVQRRLIRRFAANDVDPRDGVNGEVTPLATRQSVPSVTQRRGKRDGLGMAAGVAFVALLGGVTLWSMDSVRNAPASSARQAPPANLPPVQTAAASPPVVAQPAPAVPAQAVTNLSAPPLPAPAPQAVLAAQPGAASAVNRAASPTVVFDASALPAPMPAAAPTATTGNGNDDFAARLGGVGGGKAVATATVDPRSTVTQGTLIPAILETAIDTDVPGYVRAVVSSDVRSFDGSRVLVPRSSRLIGQYKSGLQAGQKRAYVIWTRLIRPDGVSVDIASPAVGFGGETGLEGKVDNHFFARFGSAMLLSVIGGLSTIGSGGAAIVTGGGQSAAAAAIGQTGQIGPTIRVRQGQPVRVFTARDLDFSRVANQ